MSQICSKMVKFLYSAYFGGHLCYHTNVKSQINTIWYWKTKERYFEIYTCYVSYSLYLPLKISEAANQYQTTCQYVGIVYILFELYHQIWFHEQHIC